MIRYRQATENDLGFIVDSYCQSYAKAHEVAGMNRDHYFPAAKNRIKRILSREQVTCTMATSEDDDDVILGWAAVDGPTLVYCYVRKDFRKMGIASALVNPGHVREYMFRTSPLWDDIVRKWGLELRADKAW